MKSSGTKFRTAPAYFIMLLVLVLDQLTKTLVRVNMEMQECIPLWQNLFGDTFILIRVQNTGAAFSFGIGSDLVNRIFFIGVTLLVVAIIIFLLYYAQHKIQVFAYDLILGGAFGNLIDRVIFGPVTDFFSMDFPDFIMERFPVFNIADSSIFIGVVLLIIDMIFIKDKQNTALDTEKNIEISETNKEL